jgi:peptidoglycan/LPS O-acetylase OafA/YrhL
VAGPTTRARLTHQPALDGVRGLAVAAVLLFHGGHLTGGYLGVDAFFVLSGFLITSLLLSEAKTHGDISLRAFWSRRARRLLPAVICVLLAVAFYAAFVAQPEELATIRGDALATLFYVANWRQIFTSNDYFALFRSPSPLQHTWSLAIEEQFYLLWPLLLFALVRRRSAGDSARRVLWVSSLLAAGSFLLMQVLYKPGDVSRVYYGTDTRISSILIGAALGALLMLRGPVTSQRTRTALEVVAVAGALLLAVAWSHLSGSSTTLYRGGLLVCALATAAVIAAGVHPQRGPVAHALSWRPLCALGIISYGVYLWHWPVYVFLDSSRVHLTGWPLLCVQIAVTLAVAYASYRLVERPIRRGVGSTELMLRLTPAVALVLVAVIIVTTAGAASQPATAAATGRAQVLVVGDSVGKSLVPGLQDVGVQVADTTSVGCRLVRGRIKIEAEWSHGCPWPQKWRDAVKRHHPDVVLLVTGAFDLFDVQPSGSRSFLVPGQPAWNRYYARQLQRAITILTSTGARLVIPTIPYTGSLAARTSLGERSAFDPARVRAANKVLASVAAANPTRVITPDLNAFLSPLGRYQTWLASVKNVRSDGVHFSRQGADLVARWIAPELGAQAAGKPVLIAGDSQAYSLGTFADGALMKRLGFALVTRGSLGCGLVGGDVFYAGSFHSPPQGCNDWQPKVGEAVKNTNPDVAVLLLGAWELFDHRVNGTVMRFRTPAFQAQLERALEDARVTLTSRGARLLLLTTPCFNATSGTHDIVATLDDSRRVDWINSIVTRFARAHPNDTTLADLHQLLCPNGTAVRTQDGKQLRYDGVHFTTDGANMVMRWLAPTVKQLAANR